VSAVAFLLGYLWLFIETVRRHAVRRRLR